MGVGKNVDYFGEPLDTTSPNMEMRIDTMDWAVFSPSGQTYNFSVMDRYCQKKSFSTSEKKLIK